MWTEKIENEKAIISKGGKIAEFLCPNWGNCQQTFFADLAEEMRNFANDTDCDSMCEREGRDPNDLINLDLWRSRVNMEDKLKNVLGSDYPKFLAKHTN